MKGDDKEVVLVLTEAEHDYLLRLLLDFGAYHSSDDDRVPLVRKMSQAHPVRDVPWFPRRPRADASATRDRPRGRAVPAEAL